jgi:hypothetical protein
MLVKRLSELSKLFKVEKEPLLKKTLFKPENP